MEIDFKNQKLTKLCNEYKKGKAAWGEKYAKKIFQRLAELRAASNLAEISTLPPSRCHSINAIRKDCWAVDIIHPFRLIFKINQVPIPVLADGGVDRNKVVSILIQGVEDYHGKQK